MPHESLLIIDDNPINLKLVRVVLELRGYDIREAQDAEEALRILQDFYPHLILMDLQLPGMDGLELTRRLKAAPATRSIIIVAVTSYAMKGDQERALAAGCDAYVTKPIDTEALPAMLANLISGCVCATRQTTTADIRRPRLRPDTGERELDGPEHPRLLR